MSAATAYVSEAELYPMLGQLTKFVIGCSELDRSGGTAVEVASRTGSEAKDNESLWNNEPWNLWVGLHGRREP